MDFEQDWCRTCDGPSLIESMSRESVIDRPHYETEYFVVMMECGHSMQFFIREVYIP